MAQAQAGDLVRAHYTGRLADGTIFDTSMEREPLEFTLGEGELISGFEQAVLGMTAGESKTATLLADQAYGPIAPNGSLMWSATTCPRTCSPSLVSSSR